MNQQNYAWCFLSAITFGNSARILGIVPSPYYSHQQVFHPIWKELSLRGHQVTTITTHTIDDPKLINLTEIQLPLIRKQISGHIRTIVDQNFFKFMVTLNYAKADIGLHFLSHPKVQDVILKKNGEQFDVVMAELSVISMLTFGKWFEAPLIAMTSMDATCDFQNVVGNSLHSLVYPDMVMQVEEKPSLYERFQLIVNTLFMKFLKSTVILPSQQRLVDKFFSSRISLNDVLNEISVLMINSDPIFHKVKPLIPTVVQIGGGIHIKPAKPLPKELQDTLDKARNGFVYFSMGSIFQSSTDFTNQTLNVLMEVFSEIPYTVLWKFEEDFFSTQVKNVIMSKWFPQQDVLKHPNIKVFITQGGLQSMDEGIYHHVPMIGIPVFYDQFFNVKKMVSKGFGLSIDYTKLNKEEFKATVLEVINNPKYRNKVKELAKLALDQPMTGLEKAVWWTEYVVRYNGTKHLRSSILDVPFYQYYMLDIFAVLGVIVYVVAKLFMLLFRSLKKLKTKTKLKKM